jgi:DNA polymerase-4
MPIAEAMRRCPQLIRVAPRISHYKEVSRQIFDIFHRFTPLVEGLSLDEAFLDVTASRALHGSGPNIARSIKQMIKENTQLTASVGVAENKLVAKIASDLDKPDGLAIVTAENCRQTLDPLAVSVIPGIGRQTLSRLHAANIRTIADLRLAPDHDLEPIFGRFTQRTRERASGIDNRPVISDREEKSVSAEETFDVDLSDRQQMDRELLALSETTSKRLRKSRLQAGTIQVKIRQSDFQTFTRQRSLQPPTNSTEQIFGIARELLSTWLEANPDARIRLLGVGSSRLSPAEQRDLFDFASDSAPTGVDRALDEIQDRFGAASVGRARTLNRS